ncbi:MAG: hypothetical protein ACHQK8_04685 [Bacteroidia bacterium]
MKYAVILSFLFFQFFSLQAQENFKHEFSIDAAPLFGSTNGYTLLYRYGAGNFRIRGLANYSNQTNSNTTDEQINTPANMYSNTTTNESSSNSVAEFRLGVQRNYTLEKWSFYFGMDGLFNYHQTSSYLESISPAAFGKLRTTTDSKSTTESYGFAPLIGLTYHISKRFTVSLEESFTYLTTQNSSDKTMQTYFTPIGGTETLFTTDQTKSSGESSKFDFTPSKYLRLYLGFRF